MMELVEVAEQSTFVKIDRNIRQWRWFKTPNTLAVWLWLILSANIEPHDFQKETISRGEVATSRRSISIATGLTEREVRTALEHLKATGEIAVRTRSKYQVITILRYDTYQSIPSGKASGKRPAEVRQASGNRPQSKNSKNQRTEERKDVCVATHTPNTTEVEAYFRSRGRSAADAAKFYAYNSGRGWKVGRTPISDWQSVAEMWIAQREDSAPVDAPKLDDFGRPIKPRYK